MTELDFDIAESLGELRESVNERELNDSLKKIAAIRNCDISRRERERLLVRTAVSHLPDCARHVIYLKFWKDQTLGEIVRQLGIPLGVAREQCLMALKYLEATLRPYGLNRNLFQMAKDLRNEFRHEVDSEILKISMGAVSGL